MNEVISTAGDLRRFLAQTMMDIKNGPGNGGITIAQGLAIAANAKELTASMQVEVNVAKVKLAAGESHKNLGEVTSLGKMLIGDDSVPMLSGK